MGISGRKKVITLLAGLGALILWILTSPLAGQDVPAVKPQVEESVETANFPHEKDKHRSVECSKCHLVSPAKPDVKEFPGHAVCVTCHNLVLEGVKRPVAYCGICHQRQKLTKAQPGLLVFPKPMPKGDFGTNFSHPSHLKPVLGALVPASLAQSSSAQTPRCADCHKAMEPERSDLPDITKATGHPACFKCHGEHPTKPPSMFQCAECHKLEGLLAPHLFGRVKGFRHQDHDYDIRPRKKADVLLDRSGDRLCRDCHGSVISAVGLKDIQLPRAEHCSSCHNGKIGLPDFLAKNVVDSLRR